MNNTNQQLPTLYQEYIAKSRYSRWIDGDERRENWDEVVNRYITYFLDKGLIDKKEAKLLGSNIQDLKVMPSMRCLMSAGVALDRDNVAGFNCSYVAIEDTRCFDELMYVLMCGTGVGFSVEREYVAKLPVIAETFHETDTTIIVSDSKIGWCSAFRELLAMLWAGKVPKWDVSKVRPAGARLKTFGGRACLTGDTVLYKDRKKSQEENEITIKDLFDLERSQGFWKGKPNHFNKIKLRSLDEETGKFYRNKVVTVVDNGVVPIYEITTKSGYKIKATDNHRFMDETGVYKEVKDFKETELIAVNGSPERKTGTCLDCATPISRRAQRCKPCYDKTQILVTALDTTARQRKENLEYRQDFCEACGETEKRFEIHHIDENPHNNNHVNLENLCCDCHQKEHAKRRTFPSPYSHRYLSYDEIISIMCVGEEQVYDLQMAAPNHNFIANGFVSHNSGPDPLVALFEFSCKLLKGGQGRQLTPLETHDLVCKIADIVVVGGVRRSALISLSSLDDDQMRKAKSGAWYNTDKQRALANNSAVYNEIPPLEIFLNEWASLYESKSGERGIFSRIASKKQAGLNNRRDTSHDFGTNPCLTGEMRLLTEQGYQTFEELAGLDINIVNYKGQVTNGKVWCNGVKETVTISFKDKYKKVPIRCTPDHRFMLEDGSECEAKYLKDKKVKGYDTPFYTVKSVEASGKAKVYDFSEPETHWGVVEGIITHNCSEIILRSKQFCNLTEVIVRKEDTLATLKNKIRVAAILGTLQSTLTDFKYLRKEWQRNTEEEALLGVSLTGIMDHPVLSGTEGFDKLRKWLMTMKQHAIVTNKEWAERLGVNQSTAITCVKPSGTVSQLTNTASGIHPRYSDYYIRRVRADKKDPLAQFMIDKGFLNETDFYNPSNVVFSFPIKSPEGSIGRDARTAIEQLQLWKEYQDFWCEHKPSVTVYYKDEEFLELGNWVYKNFDSISGISFLPHTDHNYKQAPYEEINKHDYEHMLSIMPKELDWKALAKFETEDTTESMQTLACSSGSCDIL